MSTMWEEATMIFKADSERQSQKVPAIVCFGSVMNHLLCRHIRGSVIYITNMIHPIIPSIQQFRLVQIGGVLSQDVSGDINFVRRKIHALPIQ
jgi:hypothetical protein